MRHSTLLFFILALLVGFILFKVKYEVVEIEQQLAHTVQQIEREKENIHVLTAEWSHLNDPQRLQKLAEKYLDIMPMKTEQITTLARAFEEKRQFKGFLPRPHFASMKEAE